MNGASAAPTWGGDILRAVAIVIAAIVLGIGVNAFSRKPMALLDPNDPGAPPPKFVRITIEELKAANDQHRQVLILDVRSPEAFAAGHATGAQNAHAPKFLEHYPTLSPWIQQSDIVVVMCDSEQCPYADRVAKLLFDAGHENVKVLHGGWQAYRASGMPTETGGGEGDL